MSTKHSTYADDRKLTRAQRRAAGREAVHHAPKHQPRRFSWSLALGGLIVVVVAGILGYAAVFGQGHGPAKAAGKPLVDAAALNPAPSLLKVGTSAPGFTLQDVHGTTYNLAAQRGHPVLLEFYAVWCPVCQREAPTMSRLTAAFAPRGVRVWAILANPYGSAYEFSGRKDFSVATAADLAWYRSSFKVHYAQLVDPKFRVVNRYGVGAYPGLYVIDKTGKISFASSGYRPYTLMVKELNRALNGTKA